MRLRSISARRSAPRIAAAATAVTAVAVLSACGGSTHAEAPGRSLVSTPLSSTATAAAPQSTASDGIIVSAPTTSAITTTTASPVDPQALLDDERVSYGATGAVAALRRGGSTRTWTSGTADVTGTPLTADTTFRVASITKPIVAALVLDAVRHGELSLDDDVNTLVPGVLRPGPAVTVRMLLQHTSGIYDEGGHGAAEVSRDIEALHDPVQRDELRTLHRRSLDGEPVIADARQLVALAETHERYFVPDAGWHYARTNYQLVTIALEAATHRNLSQLLAERITGPLGVPRMTVTAAASPAPSPEMRGYAPPSPPEGSIATTSVPPADRDVDVTDQLLTIGNGASGGVVAGAGDLLTVMTAIMAGRVIPRTDVDIMQRTTPQSDGSYGMGLVRYRLSCGVYFGHEGGAYGQVSIALASPDGTDGAVITMNRRTSIDPHLPRLADRLLCAPIA